MPSVHILAIRPGALGDTLLTLPVLAHIRHTVAHARITFISRADVLPLVQASGLADAVASYDDAAWAELFRDGNMHDGSPLVALAGTVTDAVLWLGPTGESAAERLRQLGIRRVIRAQARPSREHDPHAVLVLMEALARIDIRPIRQLADIARIVPPLIPPEDDARVGEGFLASVKSESRALVALHPGSGGAAKRWPAERFARVAKWLIDRGAQPVLIAGPADDDVIGSVVAALEREDARVDILHNARIGTVAHVLARCALYLGNDSGITHLAALSGTAVVALFGPSSPDHWAPVGPRVQTIQAPRGDLSLLDIDSVCHSLAWWLDTRNASS